MEYLGGRNESYDDPSAKPTITLSSNRKQMTSFKLYRPNRQQPIKDAQPILPEKTKVNKLKAKLALGGVKATEKILFLDNLSTMLKAGLSLTPALSTMKKEIKNKYFSNVIDFLERYVENGQLLSRGMEQYPKVFNQMIIATIEVGEKSGKLSEAAGNLAAILKAQRKLKSKVFGALMYPVIVLIALVGVSLFLALSVFPQLIGLFNDAGVKLPIILVVVNQLNALLTTYGWYTLGSLIILIIALRIIFKFPKPKYFLSWLWLKLPFVGKIVKELSLTRFSGNLHALLASGLSIVQALDIVAKTLSNLKFRKQTLAMSEELQKGVSLEKAMRERSDLFPSLAVQLVQVGESTGELENILTKLAEFYEERVNNVLNNLSTILEPVLLILVGVAVAFIALSVISPMYELTNSYGVY